MDSLVVTIESLPTELIAQIFSYLTTSPPSASRLHDQPEPLMLNDDKQDLKNASLVSLRWRAICLPILFRHVQWAFDRWDLLLIEPAQEPDPVAILPPLAFIRANDLGRHVETLTLIVDDSMKGMWRLSEAGGSPDTATFSSARSAFGSTSDAPPKTIDLVDSEAGRHPDIMSRAATYNEENNWVWDMLFELMDPRQFNIIASPRILASLLSRMLFLGDSWSFKNQYHILSISREGPKQSAKDTDATEELQDATVAGDDDSDSRPGLRHRPNAGEGSSCKCGQKTKRIPCNLFTMRPWSSILLNEGSSTRVYKTYEFFLKRPPSILGALLGAEEFPNDQPLIPPTIKCLSYVAIFPLSSHFNTLVRSLPPIDRLFVQLVPRNDILQDAKEMRNVLTSDLWMERNTCYSMVMRELLSGSAHAEEVDDFMDGLGGPSGAHTRNWRNLREFESGDAADKDAWDMAVQYVRMSQTGWRVEREGVFVRGARVESAESSGDTSESEPADEEALAATIDGFSLFQDKLERIAFSGTAHLPYSPAHQYGAGLDDWDEVDVDVPVGIIDTGMPGVHALATTWEGVVGAVLDASHDWEDHYDPW